MGVIIEIPNPTVERIGVEGLSHLQALLFKEILYKAIGCDKPCDNADDELRHLVGMASGQRGEVTLTSADQLRAEQAILNLEKAITDLHALLAPVALNWVRDVPDVAAIAIVDEHGQSDLHMDVLPKLFAGADIASRFIEHGGFAHGQPPHTFAPEEPR